MNFVHVLFLFFFVLSSVSHAAIVKSLPGFQGALPFHLETGYIGVGDAQQSQLFYYFIESEGDPKRDPLLLWLTGGPGCSALSGLVFEIGPLTFNYSNVSQQLEVPRLKLNPYSWTKVASIIFLDSPVGAGFSYATTSDGYHKDDMTASRDAYEFMKKWLADHDKFQNNPIFISGDSYSGIPVPLIVHEILNGNKAGIEPKINLKGYILGNPYTMKHGFSNGKYEFARRLSLLSDDLYKSAKISCKGNFDNIHARNKLCKHFVASMLKNLHPLFTNNVLEPKCVKSSSTWCRDHNYRTVFIWANKAQVQEALHIRKDTKHHWIRCNNSMAYTINVNSTFEYHKSFTKEFIHALVYSGDQDMFISYVDTLRWVKKLNVPVIDKWRPWFVNSQVAGYATKYSNGHYNLMFTTIKGGGHTAPEYKPRECLNMIMRWFANISSGTIEVS